MPKPVHGGERDELSDIDVVAASLLQCLQLLGCEHHILVLCEFVALDDLLPGDHSLLVQANILLLQAGAVLRMQEMEAQPLGADGRRVELHRDRNQAEGDGERCDGSRCHDRDGSLAPEQVLLHSQA